MRVKDPASSWGIPKKEKRNKRNRKPPDEDSSDDIAGLTCQHVGRAVDVNQVKRSMAQNVWSICSDCLRERRTHDGEPVTPTDVWLCLKCGHQGCSPNSEGQHSMKHFQTVHMDPHCIVISLSTWIVWCYECDEELSTHCNKKALAQIVDFLQRHASRTATGSSSKVIRLCEGNSEASEVLNGKNPMNTTSVPVKGIHNLGNTCFFNAVMQNLAQTHILNELMNEMKEKGTKMKICLAADTHPDPLVVNLSSAGALTSAMFLFLHSMKDSGKGPLSPKVLFSQLCQKAPKFKVNQQQDSQELLHYLLDAMRIEETKRIQAGILKAFNNPTTKTADEETKRKVKAYGREGVKMNLIDRIFVGELTNTIMCEECETISTVKEPFIDLSLPIIEERVSKPVPQGRTSKCKTSQEADLAPYNCSGPTTLNNQRAMLYRKQSLTRDKNLLNQERRLARKSSGDEEGSLLIMQQKNETPEGENGLVTFPPEDASGAFNAVANESPSDGSERGAGSHCESSVDADSEASECESSSKHNVLERASSPSGGLTVQNNQVSQNGEPISGQPNDCCDNEALTSTIANLTISNTGNDSTELTPGNEAWCLTNNSIFSAAKPIQSQKPQTAFQTLSHGYIPSSKECSVQSCLYQFTSVELLMGNNKLLCESCTDRMQNYQRHTNSAGNEKKADVLYTNARKQMLISALPNILILHLKRFHQAGLSLRKVNRHVDFPLILDLAPFCSASCKNVSEDEQVLYSLYGIVEHIGSMRGGHYAAYVKIRMAARKLFEHMSGNKNVQGLKDISGTSPGQWVYVSDTHVQTVPESRVLNSQAYLLFYERIC